MSNKTTESWEREFRKFREDEEHLDIWDGNVEFKKGYKGFDSFMCDIEDFISNLLSKQRELMVEEMHAVLNYELTENFDGMGWNNDGWKDELLEAINSAINKLNKLGD